MKFSLVFVASALTISAASAATPSCPPLGALPGYHAGAPRLRAYDTIEVRRLQQGAEEPERFTVSGPLCTTHYDVDQGKDPMSDLEIQSNYRDRIQKLGGEVTDSDDRDTWGRLAKDGGETWFHIYSQETDIDVTVVRKEPGKLSLTAPGPNDYRLLGHLPAYNPQKLNVRNFDQVDFTVRNGEETNTIKVQGKTVKANYDLRQGAQPAADAEVQWNYREALRRLGGEILFADDRNTTGRLIDNGQVVWVSVYSQENDIWLAAVEEKPFEPSIKPPGANQLKAEIDKSGHAALYANFDFGKATLRPEAAPVVAQVVALLKDNPALKLSVEGHTDNIGGEEQNRKLSQDRAAAIITAVTAQGIAADRLSPAGFGAAKPIASNDTSEGRAKNRRVELVKR